MMLTPRASGNSPLETILNARSASQLLETYYDDCNKRDPIWCGAVGILYLAGGLILLIPSVNVFMRVTRVMFRQMLG